MKNIGILLILIPSFLSCNASEDLKRIKSTKLYSFQIDNDDKTAFGYRHYEDDMDVGVNSMFVFKDIIYFPDRYHKNIKSFNLNTEEITTSIDVSSWITDLFVYDRMVIVVSEYDSIKVLREDLSSIEKSIQIPKGHKYFIEYNGEIFIVNLSVFKRKEEKIEYECYSVSSLMNNGKNEISLLSFNTLPARINFFDSECEINEELCLKVENQYYQLPHRLKKIKEFDAFNIFVEKQRISNYYINDSIFEVEVSNY
jgi:hypothetical protein